jgi:hypothetical protein
MEGGKGEAEVKDLCHGRRRGVFVFLILGSHGTLASGSLTVCKVAQEPISLASPDGSIL